MIFRDNTGQWLRIVYYALWGCGSPVITGDSGCADDPRCRYVGRDSTPFRFSGDLHNPHFACVKSANQTLYLNLEWEHVLSGHFNPALPIANRYGGSYYEIAAISGNSATLYTTAISQRNELRGDYSQPQGFMLPIAYGTAYHIVITPIYPYFERYKGVPYDTRCERQAITFNLEIPPETQIKQLSEESVVIVPGDVSTGFSAIVTSQNQTRGETGYQVAAGEQNLTLHGLEPELQYTVTIARNGTEIMPCRTEILNFALTLSSESGTTVYPEPSSVISVQTSAVVQSGSPLVTYSIPTEKPEITVYPETMPSPGASDHPGHGQNHLASYIVYSVDGVVYFSLATFIAITPCIFAIARYYKKRREE